VTFKMGTALDRPIVYTPDGEIGLVAQDDGSVGVFRLSAGKAPTVVHAAFKGSFSAQDVIMAPDGTHAYVLDPDTANNGGGVYDVAIACDGTLTSRGLVLPGSANALALLPADPTKGVLGGIAGDSPLGQDAHIVDLATKMRVGSAAPFPDGGALVASVAVTPDGKYALVADNGLNAGSRVAVVALAPQISGVSVLPTPFPAAVVMSPFGNAAIVLNDDSTNQIHVLSYDPARAAAPFAITGELAYKFGKPQLPTNASILTRGALKGRVFVAENLAVRQLTFGAAGGVTDTAKLAFPDTIETIVGVVGVQP
jgi:DNA-binding beta-propeller fold protein YncE